MYTEVLVAYMDQTKNSLRNVPGEGTTQTATMHAKINSLIKEKGACVIYFQIQLKPFIPFGNQN